MKFTPKNQHLCTLTRVCVCALIKQSFVEGIKTIFFSFEFPPEFVNSLRSFYSCVQNLLLLTQFILLKMSLFKFLKFFEFELKNLNKKLFENFYTNVKKNLNFLKILKN